MDAKTQAIFTAAKAISVRLHTGPGVMDWQHDSDDRKLVADLDAALLALVPTLHGFDNTDFGENGWQAVCRELGLTFNGRAPHPRRPGETSGWAWRSVTSGLQVVTCYNPDTGEHYAAEGNDFYRGKGEPGFAGYIGVEGPGAAVARAVAVIREHAIYVKNESVGKRDYI